ncbi:hypothetical protein [Trinickia sp.]|uniref:hypothetical protein n=1 Tax=Trinickia sp. TaxID=2571163 RepID=UPI003F7D4C26
MRSVSTKWLLGSSGARCGVAMGATASAFAARHRGATGRTVTVPEALLPQPEA